jgi:TonB family protein
VLLLALVVATLRLAVLRRGWRSVTVDGRAVFVSENVGPAVVGLWRPRVVLPEWARGLGDGERRLMLAHEDEHVRAGDPWLLASGTAVLILAPWNLALWWQVRRLRLAVEMDCDARVLAGDGDSAAYGELLLRVGQRRAQLPLGAPALGEPVSFLGRRIRRMVIDLPRWRWAGATVASMVGAAAFIAACEAPRPVGLRAARDVSAIAEQAQVPYSWSAAYLERLARQYHPEVFAHPLRGAAVAFVFDARDSVIGHAAGVREVGDAGCLEVVDRLVPTLQTRKWSSSGCAGRSSTREYTCVGGPRPGVCVAKAEMFPVVVYWKKLKPAQGPNEVSTESMVDERPVFLAGPPLQYPSLLRQAGIQGRVLVRAIIDTTGRAEPASVQVVESPHPGFNQAARNLVLQARFRSGRVRGRAVRVLITFPVDFRTGG